MRDYWQIYLSSASKLRLSGIFAARLSRTVCVPGRVVERGFTVIIGQFANAALGTRLSPGVVNDRRRSVDSSSRCATMRAAYASQHPIMRFFPRAGACSRNS